MASSSFRTFIVDQLSRVVPRVRARSMFGGVGIYSGDLFFALIADDTLYLKVDDSNRADFEALGMGPFRPYGEGGEVMQYYQVAADLLEDPEALRPWAEKALAVAGRKKGKRSRRGRVRLVAALLATAATAAAPAAGQSVQYRSPAGVEYRAQRDTGPIARAESALGADPRNVERILQLGLAQSGARQFREAIQTFTRGLAIAPNDPVLYRWRGHRYLSVRELDRAMDDLTRGSRLDSTNYGIWYHLGIVRYARGDFAGAADAFARAQPRAPDAPERAGATDWLWMSLSRAGRAAEAQAMLDRRPDSMPAANAYAQRLRLYRGQTAPDDVITAADTGDVAVATLSYGIGNWYLVRGDTTRARGWFERSIRSGGWPAFGFIMSEIELRRLR
jgi:TfoX/Sxy family transcriptional regulator of competence genes